MRIPFDIPSQWMGKVLSGEYIRYGSIIKETASGKIIGHLQEAGGLGILQGFVSSANPLSAITGVINTVQLSDISKKLNAVMQQLDVLQLTAQVGAAASIIGIGVSVVGFKIIADKINHLESKVDVISKDIQWIKQSLGKLNAHQDAYNLAVLKQAGENLIYADITDDENNRIAFATRARDQFHLYRNYNHLLLQQEGALHNSNLSISGVADLVRNYEYCCVGELYADFLLGDSKVYGQRIEDIKREHAAILQFSPADVYDTRCDERDVTDINFDFSGLQKGLTEISEQVAESQDRFDLLLLEKQYIDKHNIGLVEYQRELRDMEPGILLFKQ